MHEKWSAQCMSLNVGGQQISSREGCVGPTSKRLSSTMGLTLRSTEGTPAAPCLSFASLTLLFHCWVLGRRFCRPTCEALSPHWHVLSEIDKAPSRTRHR